MNLSKASLRVRLKSPLRVKAWAAILIIPALLVLSLKQVDYVGAVGSNNPITSPITFPGVTPTPVPTPPITFPGPTQTPTPAPVPSPLGYTEVGSKIDVYDSNYINGSKFITGSQVGTVQSMSVYVTDVDSYPNDQFQMAIYASKGGKPDTLVASSQTGQLTPNSWNTLVINATLQPNTKYFLFYNTNGLTPESNNMAMDTGNSKFYGAYSSNPVEFGYWPQNFDAIPTETGNWNWSIYASY